MAIHKQLKYKDFSEDRKKALKEIQEEKETQTSLKGYQK